MTNREKINAMSNAELARLLVDNDCNCSMCIYSKLDDCGGYYCAQGYEKWLEQEVQEC